MVQKARPSSNVAGAMGAKSMRGDGNRPLGGSDLGRSSGGDRGGVLLRLQV